jgi:hypothetical protein
MVVAGALWCCYLSIVNVQAAFTYSYGWEWLTCEAGFLAIFLCPPPFVGNGGGSGKRGWLGWLGGKNGYNGGGYSGGIGYNGQVSPSGSSSYSSYNVNSSHNSREHHYGSRDHHYGSRDHHYGTSSGRRRSSHYGNTPLSGRRESYGNSSTLESNSFTPRDAHRRSSKTMRTPRTGTTVAETPLYESFRDSPIKLSSTKRNSKNYDRSDSGMSNISNMSLSNSNSITSTTPTVSTASSGLLAGTPNERRSSGYGGGHRRINSSTGGSPSKAMAMARAGHSGGKRDRRDSFTGSGGYGGSGHKRNSFVIDTNGLPTPRKRHSGYYRRSSSHMISPKSGGHYGSHYNNHNLSANDEPLPPPRGYEHTLPPSPLVIWLYRWLAFRLLIGAGMSKVGRNSSKCWRELTCTTTHYNTQPIPNPLSWYFHFLPFWTHELEVMMTFLEQLVLPYFMLVPHRGFRVRELSTICY